MPARPPSHDPARNRPARSFARALGRSRGFTLIELAVVILLLVIVLGMVGVNLVRGPADVVRDEAQRLALLLQTAQQEAILEGRFYAFAPDVEGYGFLRLDDTGMLVPLAAGDPLGPRLLPASVTLELTDIPPMPGDDAPPLIVFEPSGAMSPFTVVLQTQDSVWYVRADGSGRIRPAATRQSNES